MTKATNNAKHYEYTDRWGDPIDIFFAKTTYAVGGGICVECYCSAVDEYDGETYEEAYAPITVNFGQTLSPDICFVDENNSKHLIDWMVAKGLVVPTGGWITSGFCTYPSVKLSQDFLDGLVELSVLLGD